eukprot:361692-Chlamydomonas_euryale.AAC.4
MLVTTLPHLPTLSQTRSCPPHVAKHECKKTDTPQHTRYPPPRCASRSFYDKAHKIDMLDFFKQFAVSPDELPDAVFASIGRTIWRDIGPTAVTFRMMMKCAWGGRCRGVEGEGGGGGGVRTNDECCRCAPGNGERAGCWVCRLGGRE